MLKAMRLVLAENTAVCQRDYGELVDVLRTYCFQGNGHARTAAPEAQRQAS